MNQNHSANQRQSSAFLIQAKEARKILFIVSSYDDLQMNKRGSVYMRPLHITSILYNF